MNRVILHSDANSFYASVECLYRPEIRDKPVAVCGDPLARHGIVLTKNQIAKQYKIQTGETILQAKLKCPGLVVVPPDYPMYMHFSEMLRSIYEEYTDRVEAFGLDENWLDISNTGVTIEDGARIADEIRARVREELGITVSMGVSYNKIFAKLGSDMKKPDATTVITPENFKEKVWPLPSTDLLYVGNRRAADLKRMHILTIGDLARADGDMLAGKFGIVGWFLKGNAMGLDSTPVQPMTYEASINSVGNSSTLPHDVTTMDHARSAYFMLAESVGARVRAHGFKARCVSISVRTTDLMIYSCQRTIPATALTTNFARTALALFSERYARLMPFRSLGLTCSSLIPDTAPEQTSMFGDDVKRMRAEALERTLDGLRSRFGHQIVQRGVVLTDRAYAAVNPRDDHTIHPVAFLTHG